MTKLNESNDKISLDDIKEICKNAAVDLCQFIMLLICLIVLISVIF